MSKIREIFRCNEGVELVCEEERGFTKRTYVFDLVLTKEDLDKINKIMESKK